MQGPRTWISTLTKWVSDFDRLQADWRRRLATGAGAVLIGLIAIAFAEMADWAQHLFLSLYAVRPGAATLAAPILFALAVFLTHRFFPAAGGSGIPQVIAVLGEPSTRSTGPLVAMRTVIAKLFLTVMLIGAGGSVGREGPTVQVGAALMVWVHRILRVPVSAGVLIAGGAAGVAAAFNTPLAGVAFAIEELAAAYEQRVAVLVMGAVMVAGLVSLGVAGDYVYFGTMHAKIALADMLLLAPLAGVLGGVAGGLFARALLAFAAPDGGWIARCRAHPVLFAALCGAVVGLTGYISQGQSWGTGYEPTRQLIEGRELWSGFGVAKFVATLATALSGAPGGIFAPSLSVGAGLGQMLSWLFPAASLGAVVLMGMIGYFTGVVRAPLTAVIIISETTASRGMLLPLFATALIADFVSAKLCKQKLYSGLARASLPDKSAKLPGHD